MKIDLIYKHWNVIRNDVTVCEFFMQSALVELNTTETNNEADSALHPVRKTRQIQIVIKLAPKRETIEAILRE